MSCSGLLGFVSVSFTHSLWSLFCGSSIGFQMPLSAAVFFSPFLAATNDAWLKLFVIDLYSSTPYLLVSLTLLHQFMLQDLMNLCFSHGLDWNVPSGDMYIATSYTINLNVVDGTNPYKDTHNTMYKVPPQVSQYEPLYVHHIVVYDRIHTGQISIYMFEFTKDLTLN